MSVNGFESIAAALKSAAFQITGERTFEGATLLDVCRESMTVVEWLVIVDWSLQDGLPVDFTVAYRAHPKLDGYSARAHQRLLQAMKTWAATVRAFGEEKQDG